MKWYLSLFTGILLLAANSLSLAATESTSLGEAMVNPGYHDKPAWFKLSLLDIKEDVADAQKAGKRVILYFYQDGCPYCKKLLEDNFGNEQIASKTRKHFDVIAINMWGDRDVVDLQGKDTIEKEFAKQMRVMFTPTLLFLDEQGNVALRINGYYYPKKFDVALDFVAGHHEKEMNLSQYQAKVQGKPEGGSGTLHIEASYLQPPYNLAQTLKTHQRPLLVLFERKHCEACDELHLDIFQKPETREALKAFDVVLLDMNSKGFIVTPEGKPMRISDWAIAKDIKYTPSMVFLDASGKEVFRTEAFLRTFHVTGAMTYVSSGSYKTQPSFQRYLQGVNEEMSQRGEHLDLMR
jgi:thioredoxin-related protein